MSAPLMGVAEIRRRQTMSAQDQAAEAEREESMKQCSSPRPPRARMPLSDVAELGRHASLESFHSLEPSNFREANPTF
jgi:hypothetical protein